MSGDTQWQKPRYLEPDQLAQTPARDEQVRARELPLTAVSDVAEDESSPATVSAAPSQPRRSRGRRLFALSIGGLLTAGVGIELYRLLQWGFATHPWLGAGLSGLLALALISGGTQVWRSLRGLRQLRQTEALQQQAERLLLHSGQGQASRFLKQLEVQYQQRPGHQTLLDAIRDLDSAYSDAEVVRYLSRHALTEQDARARRCVQRYSIESGVLVALSPWATFDMLLVGWRNLRMLREIAAIYGIAPGAAAQWALLRRVLHSLAFAGASEMAIDAGSAALGSSLTSTLSARAGQGLGAGLFTARTGVEALRLCRPLPQVVREEPLLNAVASGIVERLRRG
jgi:putative membrane protein